MGAAENAVVKSCMATLTRLGVPHIRNNTGAHLIPATANTRRRFVSYGTGGWPDIIACLPFGRFCGIECKAPDNPITGRRSDLSKDQKAVRYQLLKSGALYLTVRSGQEMCDDLKAEGYFEDSL